MLNDLYVYMPSCHPLKRRVAETGCAHPCIHTQRCIDTWNGLKGEVIMAKNVHQLKEKKLDKYR